MLIKTKRSSELSVEQLVSLVARVQAVLFAEGCDNDGEPVFNPDKECGADELGDIINLLHQHGLAPKRRKE